MDIREHFDCSPDWGETYLKDCNLRDFNEKFPEVKSLIQQLRQNLSDGYKYYLVDFIVQDCKPGSNTCRDIRWHFDGDYNKDNQYVLWVKGPNRTQFAPNVHLDPPESRELQNQYLEKILTDIVPITAPDSTIVAYDSRTPHRGVKCDEYGKRIFVRMLASNYITPKRIKENHASV